MLVSRQLVQGRTLRTQLGIPVLHAQLLPSTSALTRSRSIVSRDWARRFKYAACAAGDLQPQHSSALPSAAAQSQQASLDAAPLLGSVNSNGCDNEGDHGAAPQQPPGSSSCAATLGVPSVAPAAEMDATALQQPQPQQRQQQAREVDPEQHNPAQLEPAATAHIPSAVVDSSSGSTFDSTQSLNGAHSTFASSGSNLEGQSADAGGDGPAVQASVLQAQHPSPAGEPAANSANSPTTQSAESSPAGAAGFIRAADPASTVLAGNLLQMAPAAAAGGAVVGPADESSDNTMDQDEINQQLGLAGEVH